MKKIVVCVLMLAMLCGGCDDNNSIYMKEIVNMKSAVSDVNVVHSNGGGVTYTFSSDSFDEFSFFDVGDQRYYIRINSNWYQVEENIDFSVTTEK